MSKEYYVVSYDAGAAKLITQRLNDKQVIDYLEEKVELLEKILNNLKQFYGEEYYEASKELNEFLARNKIAIREK